jgi:hypothetical protein
MHIIIEYGGNPPTSIVWMRGNPEQCLVAGIRGETCEATISYERIVGAGYGGQSVER